jgi:segregation and condensation protein B
MSLLPLDLESALEALIFAAPGPLTIARIKEILSADGHAFADAEVSAALQNLMAKWRAPDRPLGGGLELAEVAGGYMFRTRPRYGSLVKALFAERAQKLSQSQLEVLALIAYRQPITRLEIEEVRGSDCSAAVKKLLNTRAIKILGKSEALGRPLLYGTTKQFLELFGLNSLHDLPTIKDMEALQGNKEGLFESDALAGPLSLEDLFEAGKDNSLLSEQTERLSEAALKTLEEALGAVKQVSQTTGLDAAEKSASN